VTLRDRWRRPDRRSLADRWRPDRWRLAVPVVAVAAGLLFATSATTADGTDLRSDRRLRLAELVADRERQLASVAEQARQLSREVSALRASATTPLPGPPVPDDVAAAVGLTAVQGPAVTVRLDDAPRAQGGADVPGGVTPDDLVVHEQDVQAVVNALRAGGAEAMTVMGERITGTSAVRCVGNTLLLHGKVFSPPFEVTAVGDPARLRDALAASPGVALYLRYVDAYGLGWSVDSHDSVTLPPYDGVLELPSVEA
jgi:uncharacterized protein YlxW (UPF0749 family)